MKQYNSWQGYKRLLTFIKPYKTRLVFAVICMALSGASNVVVPWLIKDVIDKVLANKDIYTLNLIVIGILVLFLLRGVFYFGERYLMSFVGQKSSMISAKNCTAICRPCPCLTLISIRQVIS